MQHAIIVTDTTEARASLPAGQRQLLRRFEQASRRAERHQVAYEAAARARAELAAQMLRTGISERQLAALAGLSRRRVRVMAESVSKPPAPAPSECSCGFWSPCPVHDEGAAS